MSSNLPPGVTDSMLPGNRPEDSAWEKFHCRVDQDATDWGLDADDALAAWEVGLKAWVSMRDKIFRETGQMKDTQIQEEDDGA